MQSAAVGGKTKWIVTLQRVCQIYLRCGFTSRVWILKDPHNRSFTGAARCTMLVDRVWNVMAHAQKPDFVFMRNGRVHLNRPAGASVQSTAGSRGVRISGSNDGYTMFRGSVKSTGYPLHSPVSPSLTLPCVTVCHHISTRVYINSRNEAKIYEDNIL